MNYASRKLDFRNPQFNALTMKTGPAYAKFRAWQAEGRLGIPEIGTMFFPTEIDELIAKLLGYACCRDMALNYRAESDHLLQVLAGEHGWSVYKMLLARMEK